ncbi:MAG: DNA recombination protein RmuC [Armatimonadetes bacterium]|nr:DNA recombination protein RmuC [Armatimonadota bacterium]
MQFHAVSFFAGAVLAALLAAFVVRKHFAATIERLQREKTQALAQAEREKLQAESQLRQDLAALQASLEAQQKGAEERLQAAQQALANLEDQLQAERDRAHSAGKALAAAEEQLSSLQQRLEEQRTFLEQAQQQLRDSFAAMAADTLHQAANAFRDQARETLAGLFQTADQNLADRHRALDELLKPLSQAIEAYRQEVGQMDRARQQAEAGLREALTNVVSAEEALKQEAQKLRAALSQPQMRGRWGEIQLRRLVEHAGMVEHCDFDAQVQVKTDDGRLRPDLVVHLPGDPPRKIPVDAKVPLDDYLRALDDSLDENARTAALQAHAKAVRKHIDNLASKEYQQSLGTACDFVVMYLPLEPLYIAAAQADPTLVEYAVQKRVLLATPFTFFGLLSAAAAAWKQQTILENAEHIAKASQDLFERMHTFVGHLREIGQGLKKTCDAFDKATRSWNSRVVPAGRRVVALGGAPKGKEMPEIDQLKAPVDSSPHIVGYTGEASDDNVPALLSAAEPEENDETTAQAADATQLDTSEPLTQ